eukprot:12415216-Karenia_brevis.AAC.1
MFICALACMPFCKWAVCTHPDLAPSTFGFPFGLFSHTVATSINPYRPRAVKASKPPANPFNQKLSWCPEALAPQAVWTILAPVLRG